MTPQIEPPEEEGQTPGPSPVRPRPPGIILAAAVLIWIRLLVSVFGVLVALAEIVDLDRPRDEDLPGRWLVPVLVLFVAFLILWAGVSIGLLRRERWARLAGVGIEAVGLVVYALLWSWGGGLTVFESVGALVGVGALLLLLGRRAAEWCSIED